ncbi:MAG: hypothetical protein ACREBG_01360, partial [Pyrinomonadaceae bacterium]
GDELARPGSFFRDDRGDLTVLSSFIEAIGGSSIHYCRRTAAANIEETKSAKLVLLGLMVHDLCFRTTFH